MEFEVKEKLHNLELTTVKNTKDLEFVKEKIACLENEVKDAIKDLNKCFNDRLMKLQEKLDEAIKRPSWAVALIITFLVSLTIGLITYVVCGG